MNIKFFKLKLLVLTAALMFGLAMTAAGQTTAFTYQGRFTDSTLPQPTNGSYAMSFKLFDAAAGGNQIGSTVNLPAVQVVNGIFTVSLDYTAAGFDGAARFLEITVTNTVLSPRQEITAAPYAITARRALQSNDSLKLGGINADQYVTGQVVRSVNNLTNNVTLAAGSNVTITPSGNTLIIAATGGAGGDNIQNQQSSVQSASFNISGNGRVGGFLTGGAVSTETFYRIGTQIVFNTPNATSIAIGQSAGFNATGGNNAFFGTESGGANTTGTSNSFFGFQSGRANLNGNNNAFFGYQAGKATIGGSNTFVGSGAGSANTNGTENTYLGFQSGSGNGSKNTVVGSEASAGGNQNTVIGQNSSVSGSNNTSVGTGFFATGNNNTLIGSFARTDTSQFPVNNSTAIGAGAVADLSNSIVLGTNQETVRIPGILNVSGNASASKVTAAQMVVTGGSLKMTVLASPTGSGNQPLCLNGSNFVAACPSSFSIAEESFILKRQDPTAQINEQNARIAAQAEQIRRQQTQIEALKQIVCQMSPAAQICGR